MPVNFKAYGTSTFAVSPIISDSSREPEELPAAPIVRSRVERQNTPRPAGGLSSAHFPAAHESAVSVSISASSSLASCGLRGFKLFRVPHVIGEFEPGGRARTATGQAHHPDRRTIEVVVDPVRGTVEVLHRVQRSPQRHQHERLPHPVDDAQAVVRSQSVLPILQQVGEECIELRVALEFAAQIVEVQKPGPADYPLVDAVRPLPAPRSRSTGTRKPARKNPEKSSRAA